jgi:MPBQ/MSBQ methyltransferase
LDTENARRGVEGHYGRGRILDAILEALGRMGKDLAELGPEDLAPVDAFHLRGREATVELAERAALTPGLRVLDVGSGLGGSARYLASAHGVVATGIDLTPDYVDVARALADLMGLGDCVAFHQCSALQTPFDAGSFDVVWTEHVQMNVAEKEAFYAEIARVLVPRGRLVFHDIFEGDGGPLHFPVPWAEDPAISFLATPEAVSRILQDLGFRILVWEDASEASLAWLSALVERLKGSAPVPLGTHLLMGTHARDMIGNITRNLREGRVRVIQAVAEKR